MPGFSPRQGNSKPGKMLFGGETDEGLDALFFGKYPGPVNAYFAPATAADYVQHGHEPHG